MVIAAGAQESRLRPHPFDHIEAEHAGIESDRTIEVSDFQVHVSDGHPWVNGHGSS
jgi:hypothetical protein